MPHTLYIRWVRHVDDLAKEIWLMYSSGGHTYIEWGLLGSSLGQQYANLTPKEWVFSFSFQIWQNYRKGNSILHCVRGWKGFGISWYQPPSSRSCSSHPKAQRWTDPTWKGIHSVISLSLSHYSFRFVSSRKTKACFSNGNFFFHNILAWHFSIMSYISTHCPSKW